MDTTRRAAPTREEAERDHGELRRLLDGCLSGVAEEVAAVREELARRGLDRPLPAVAGRLASSAGPGHRYDWELTGPPPEVRPEDGVRVRTAAGESLGFVSAYDRRAGTVRVVVGDWLGQTPGPAELEFDPSWLLTALAHRLEGVRDRPRRYHPETVLRLFGRRFPELGRLAPRGGVDGLNGDQRTALERLLGSQVHFVWGPPGTGKTRLLGCAVAELARAGNVLVVATTNGAVDEAAARVADALGEEAVRANRIVRAGASHAATGDPRLSLEAALERRVGAGAGGVADELTELESRLLRGRRGAARRQAARGDAPGGRPGRRDGRPARGAVRARHGRLVAAARAAEDEEALERLSRLAGELHKQAVLALRDADVVLTTLARLAVRDELAALRFHAMVLDEASTAPLPYVALAAALTSGRAVAIGDFQQLPAVVVSRGQEARRWLDRDVFREAGVVRDAPADEIPLPSEHDRLCAMLREQYRMAPPIRALVSEMFYGGRLTDAPEVLGRPGPAAPLVLLETGSLQPSVDRLEGSRANAAHAEAVLRFLEAAAAAGIHDVAVVAPYRLQIRRLRDLVRGRLGRAAPRRLEVSTIHSFQGREKSVVVFDTVDAPPDRSWFLHEGRNRDFPRLLNVALSRTRDMLVVVGTAEGLRETLPEDALLNRIVERVAREGAVVEARRLPGVARGLF